MVKTFSDAVEAAGLTPISCEISALTEISAIEIPAEDLQTVNAVINIGCEITTMCCVVDGRPIFLRPIAIGGNDFTTAIQTKLGCTWEEAESMKIRSGLEADPADMSLLDTPESTTEFINAQEALQEVADRMTQELSNAIRLFEKQYVNAKISSLRLLGGGSKLRGYGEQAMIFLDGKKIISVAPKEGMNTNNFTEFAASLGMATKQEMSLLSDDDHKSFQLTWGNQDGKKTKKTSDKPSKRKTTTSKKSTDGPSPKLIGLLIAVALLAGMNFYGKKIGKEVDALKTQSPTAVVGDRSKLPVPKYTGPNATVAAQNAASAVAANLNPGALNAIAAIIDRAHPENTSIRTSQGNVISVSGTLPDAALVGKLKTQLQSAPGVTALAASPNKLPSKNGEAFSFVLNAPVDAGVK